LQKTPLTRGFFGKKHLLNQAFWIATRAIG